MAGLARVFRLASDYPVSFRDWVSANCEDVEELPVDKYVLLLPSIKSDLGWAPVITHGDFGARFTWVHPDCVSLVDHASLGGVILVGHTDERGPYPPSHCIGMRAPGVRIFNEELVLDARWKGRGENDSDDCSGYCTSTCIDFARDAVRVADVLTFAIHCRSGLICCNRAKHRSVAAAQILQHVFHRRVNYSYAARQRCAQCCGRPAHANIHEIYMALRSLPNMTKRNDLLAYHLRLPVFDDGATRNYG